MSTPGTRPSVPATLRQPTFDTFAVLVRNLELNAGRIGPDVPLVLDALVCLAYAHGKQHGIEEAGRMFAESYSRITDPLAAR